MLLENKNAIVYGAGGAVGGAVARAMARDGAVFAAGLSPAEFQATEGSGTLTRRLPRLAEVANAAVLLASDRASAMTAVQANVTCGSFVDI